MNAGASGRGALLAAGGESVRFGPGWLARLWSGSVARILDRIDRGLERGTIHAELPDGSRRVIGGRAPGFEAHITLHSANALLRLATSGSVGWYKAWELGEWSSPDPVPIFALFMDNATALGNTGRARGPWRLMVRFLHFARRNTRIGAVRNIHAHYDLGNDFYAAWLGRSMSYSSAIFQTLEAADAGVRLDRAQEAKIASIVRRAAVPQGGSVLEIGCGWGAQAFALASHGACVDAISLSDEQLAYCRDRLAEAKGGFRPPIDFRKQDYRDVHGQYDAIVSVEMVEALGREYWPDFMDCLARNLKPGGRAVLQFIVMHDGLFEDYARSADFIQTYIFPGGMLIREREFRALAEARGLEWTDRVAFGDHYAETLRLWRANFDAAVEGGRLPPGFDERFVRLWRFYLMYCEGGFMGGGIDVVQATLIKRDPAQAVER